MKKYKIKPTKNQIKIMKIYWKSFNKLFDKWWKDIQKLEKQMEKRTGIKGIEFIKDTMFGDWIGIGNDERTMRLFQTGELDDSI